MKPKMTVPKQNASATARTLVIENPDATIDDLQKRLEKPISKARMYTLLWRARKAMPQAAKPTKTKKVVKAKPTPVVLDEINIEPPIDLFSVVPGTELRGVSGALYSTGDAVNHPQHYKVGGIETIDFIEAKKLGYNMGNAVKYISRADHKGNKKQDLMKAVWYLNRELDKMES